MARCTTVQWRDILLHNSVSFYCMTVWVSTARRRDVMMPYCMTVWGTDDVNFYCTTAWCPTVWRCDVRTTWLSAVRRCDVRTTWLSTVRQCDVLLYNGVMYGRCDFLLYDGVMYDGGVRCPFEKLRSKNGFARRTTASRRSADRIPERECPAFHTFHPPTVRHLLGYNYRLAPHIYLLVLSNVSSIICKTCPRSCKSVTWNLIPADRKL